MAELKKTRLVLPKPIQSQHHRRVKLNQPKVSDMGELVKRKNSEAREWTMWAIDKEFLVDEREERLSVEEHNFSEFFTENTSDLVRDEFYSQHVNPFVESQKKVLSKIKSLVGNWHEKRPSPVPAHIENFNDRILQLQLDQKPPMLELQKTLEEASSTLSAIHDEAQRSNKSNSMKWWIGFGALVIFTFFGVNIQKLVDWFQWFWPLSQSI